MKLMKKAILIFCISILFTTFSKAQEMSLKECITTAIENNIDIKRAILNHESARINSNESKSGRLPSLDANFNLGQNYGRSIDPFTNGYVNQQLTFSNVRLNSDLLLYNGMRVKNEIEQAKFGLIAADLERQELEDNLALLVTRAYLEVLNIRTVLELSVQRAESTRLSLEQIQKAFDVGSGDPSALYDFKGQYAADQLRVIDAENLLKTTRLALFQLMNIDNDDRISFLDFINDSLETDYNANEIYTSATSKFEAFEARDQRIKEAQIGIKAQKSALMPSIFLFAGVNSNFSSAAQRLNILDDIIKETGDYVQIDQIEVPVLERTNNFSSSNISYGNQIFDNLSPNFGVALNYPIFNQNIQKNRIQRAEVLLKTVELEKSTLELEFRQAIEQSILNYNNANRRLELLQVQVDAFEESFRINQVRLENGVSNRIEYIISKNNLETAKLTLANAKFDLLMQQQIIEFYRS